MALTSKNLAPFIATSVIADGGEYDEIAKSCVAQLATELGLGDLDAVVAEEIKHIDMLDDDAFDEYLATSAENITDKEAVLLVCLDVLASDLVISIDEMANYFSFADILDVSEDRASEIFNDFVDEVDDLVIEYEEDEN
ncbi:hypothetical protein LU293_06290 [Moraxella nasovis]|uniref:hypothetical protein n=1 Tax=Moraxella nasovis TaxID=2904121 RepID=UPI001F617DBA|nr:hypothetical protein [Moraxella nasovis]UNU72723.1 hypothetical protein LU293_06290 [Moraxella nasovis]